jgi:hypothetical protein
MVAVQEQEALPVIESVVAPAPQVVEYPPQLLLPMQGLMLRPELQLQIPEQSTHISDSVPLTAQLPTRQV